MKIIITYQNLKNAVAKFSEALDFKDDEVHRESLIQRFEYTFELSWKLMHHILADQGSKVYGVKNIIREAGRLDLIDNVEQWIIFANARNKAAHIYLENVAVEVANTAKDNFKAHVEKLLDKTTEIYPNVSGNPIAENQVV